MKLLNFYEYLTEKRRNPEVNRDINIIEFIKNTIGNDSLDNWFISFRQKDTVTFVNPFTEYNTPAGYYAYPFNKEDYNELLSKYDESSDNSSVKTKIKDIYPFFPRGSNIIHLFKIKQEKVKSGKILTRNSKAFKHIKEFYKICKTKKILKDNLPQAAFDLLEVVVNQEKDYNKVSELIENIKPNDYEMDQMWSKLKLVIKKQKKVSMLWFFINNYVDLVKTGGAQLKTKIYLDLGIEGFIDRGEDWFIHPNEPEQAIFFTRDVIENLYSYDIIDFVGNINNLLNKVIRGRYEIKENNVINVDGDVFFNSKADFYRITEKYKFGNVTGSFICKAIGITSLLRIGIPEYVGRKFDCSNNKLKSLEGCPKKVDGEFVCNLNELKTLEGISTVKTNVKCKSNDLKTLKGLPNEIGGDLDCTNNKLKSLESCPQKIIGNFVCSDNKLTSLKGGPKEVGFEQKGFNFGGDYNCSDNKLKTLEGAPNYIRKGFDCSNNQLTSLEGAPKEVEKVFDCSHNNLTSLKGAPEKVRGFMIMDNKKEFTVEEIKNVIDVSGFIDT
jgi:hypothetical protein